MTAGYQPLPYQADEKQWRLLFSPKGFVLENPDLDLDSYRLDAAVLRDYGNYISDVRKQIRALAERLDTSVGLDIGLQVAVTARVARKMSRWNQMTQKESSTTDHRAFIEETSESMRKRVKKRQKVSHTEILSLAHRVLVENEYVADAAKAFRISAARVSQLVKRVSKDITTLEAMRQQHYDSRNREAIIRQQILSMLAQRRYLDSCETVRLYIKGQTDLDPSRGEVLRVMKDQLHMRFKKVQRGPIHLNSVRNRILRQQGATRMLQLINEGKILINIDESWLNECDFRRMKWREYGTSNTLPGFPLTPRITVIVALDSLGNIYLTLTQANSNNSTMQIYFHHLCAKLDRERPQWREDSVILLDGAKYHTSTSTLTLLADLRVPVMFFGPHSYNLAVAELFFSFLKSTHLNPHMLPTGKK